MPATLTASKIGVNSSAVRGLVACTAGATSLDVITINHGLGYTPHVITPTLRSVVASASLGGFGLSVLSYDATKVVLALPLSPGGGATSSVHDVVIVKLHTIVR